MMAFNGKGGHGERWFLLIRLLGGRFHARCSSFHRTYQGSLLYLSGAGSDLLRRPHCPSGVFPCRVRHASPLAVGSGLRGSSGAVSVSPGPGQQSGRLRSGTVAGWGLGSRRCLDGLHLAFGPRAGAVCVRGCILRRAGQRGYSAWAQGGGRGDRRPCGLGHGAQAVPGSAACRHCAGGGADRRADRWSGGDDSGHSRWRGGRYAVVPGLGVSRPSASGPRRSCVARLALPGVSPRCPNRSGVFHHAADRAAGTGLGVVVPGAVGGGCLLPCRCSAQPWRSS